MRAWITAAWQGLAGKVAVCFSVSTLLVGLILLVLTPFLAFTSVLVIRSAEHEQSVMSTSVRDATRTVATTLERKLAAWRAQLFLLAGEAGLRNGNLTEFHARASALMHLKNFGVVLTNAAGQEIVNTRVPFGTPLPGNPDPAAIERVLRFGEPYISGGTISPVTHRVSVTMNIPVKQNGTTEMVLSADVADALQAALTHLDLAPGWIATIADRNGRTIARTRDAERYVGQRIRPDAVRRAFESDEGWFPGRSREGIALYTAFDHIRLADWTIFIGMPTDVLFAPVRFSTLSLVISASLTLVLAVLLAFAGGRSIAAPVKKLVAMTGALGRGEAVQPIRSRLREANVVAAAVQGANAQLRARAAESQAATTALERRERQYKRLAERLSELNDERQLLLQRTVAAEATERQRIARELHDSLGQYLTAIQLGLNALERWATLPRPPATETLQQLRRLSTDLAQEVNRIAWELRPVALDDLGLQTAVTQYLEEWADRSGLTVDLEITLGDRRMPAVIETTIFRVLQEAFTNVVRHASATQVGVILNATRDWVRLIVEDNGCGVRACRNGSDVTQTKRLGLIGVRERLALVNGIVEVESPDSGGTTLFIQVPIP